MAPTGTSAPPCITRVSPAHRNGEIDAKHNTTCSTLGTAAVGNVQDRPRSFDGGGMAGSEAQRLPPRSATHGGNVDLVGNVGDVSK